MPHHKSAKKRVGTNEKARVANLAVKSRVRTAVKKVRESKSQKDAVVRLESALSILDRAAQKGIIHRSTASRHKSRLTLFVHKLPGRLTRQQFFIIQEGIKIQKIHAGKRGHQALLVVGRTKRKAAEQALMKDGIVGACRASHSSAPRLAPASRLTALRDSQFFD